MKIKTKPKAIKLVAAVLSLLMINSVLPFFAVTASAESITPTTPQKDTGGVYQIGTEAELYWFADKVNNDYANYGNANAVLTADIVVNTGVLKADGTLNAGTFKSWTSIGNESNKYTGTFDGQGHTVSGLYFNDININTDFVGLFGCLGSGGEIKNVGVIDSHFYGYKSVGGVCGYNEGTITGCYNTGKVSCSSNSVGGVCGRNYNGTITGCYNTGKVSGDGEVGGVCGSNGGTITGCYNTGAVSGTDHVGGVCGYNYGTITDCNNTGTVSGTANLGGVCAENNGTITGCYNIGTVSGNDNVGGVCGYNNNNGKITGCYNIGTVSGDTRVGGVCGWNYGTITGCYNTGKVSSSNNSVGGVCGRNYNGKITGCYTNSGDVFGLNEGNVIDCEVKSDTEFKNGTVCTQLNNALKNANSDLRFYQGANYPKLCVIPKSVNGVYLIGTEAELYWFADKVNNDNANYGNVSAVLTADIVVNTGVLKDDGTLNSGTFTDWTPIGNGSNKYTGKFDGQGHTVSGLYFNDTSTDYVGLFGYLGSGGEIKNVGVIDSYFVGWWQVGGVCGVNGGTITDCYNTGTVSGTGDDVGGVCGLNERDAITGCYNTGTVSGTGNNVGGVCGLNYYSEIIGCYNTGTVSGSSDVGGVCGQNYLSEIIGCYNTGTVSGSYYVGGVCGENSGPITGSYNTGTVSGTGSSSKYIGGVCGRNDVTITGCYTNNDTGSVCGGGSGTVTDCDVKTDAEFADGTVCGLLNTALINYGSDVRFYQGVKSPEFIRTPQLVNNVYQISCASELYGFAQLVNNGEKSANAVLTADIVVNKDVLKDDDNHADDTSGFTSWTPIGNKSKKYTGKFDGQGHTVSGLYFNNTNTNYVGLFGYLNSGGEIKNVGVIDSYFKGSSYVGGVCGYNNGTITGCYNTGTFRCSGHYVGGVCGRNYGTITGCYNTGTVNGTVSAGGVCGRNENGKITDCYNTGTVRGSGDKIGGVCGLNYGTISNCYNTGTVSGYNDYVGGVCGWNINTGTTTGCYNTGTVSGYDDYFGGVCGSNSGTMTGCYNTGTVSATNYVGGVCGSNSSTMTGCYTNSGGVCGVANGTVTACAEYTGDEFNDGTVCTQLNTALKNANYEVRFCQRIGTDASPLLTYQFESVDEHTVDTYTVDNNTFKATCFCEQKSGKTMELTLTTQKNVVANGADNTLTATLSNLENEVVTYKWYQDGVEIENATSSTYKMPNDLAIGKYTYKVEVTMANVGTITQSVDVLVDITPQYYVEIPASVNIGDSFTVSASNVLLKNNAQLKVSLLSDFTLSTPKGSLLNYEILNNSIKLNSGDTLLTVAGSENPTAPGSGTSDTYNVALAQGEKPKYSGNYTDTLTFTIKVEP